jgi:hypothetical protein
MQHARCTWRSLPANARNAHAAIPKVCLEHDHGAHLSGSFVLHQRLIAGRTIAWSERGLAGVIAGRRSGRPVPCPPPLTRLLREHLADFAGEPADPLFGDAWPTVGHHHIPPRREPRPSSGALGRGVRFAARPPPIRPSPCMPVHLAQRGTPFATGGSADSGSFSPLSGTGTYRFEARLRNISTGAYSSWSPPRSLSVTTGAR